MTARNRTAAPIVTTDSRGRNQFTGRSASHRPAPFVGDRPRRVPRWAAWMIALLAGSGQ